MKLEVGQRIELFQILTHGGYRESVFTIGSYRPGVINAGNTANVLDNEGSFTTMVIIPFFAYKREARRIGAMIIKSLK